MLGLGLVQGSNAFLVGSTAASLLAAVVLIVGARRAAAARATVAPDAYDGLGDEDSSPSRAEKRAAAADRPQRESTRRAEGTVYGRDAARSAAEPATGILLDDEPERAERDQVTIPNQNGDGLRGRTEAELDDD